MNPRSTLRRPIVVGTLAIACTFAVLVASNIVFTRHYLLVGEMESVPQLGAGYWLLLAAVDVALAAVIAALVSFVVSNARAILQMRRQDSFIDGVTHELKSPLASLRLALDTLDRRNVPDDVRARFMSQMSSDVDRLQLFIEHILEAGRLQNRERHFEVEPTDLRDLADRCIEQIRRRHGLDGGVISVAWDLPEGTTTVTDPVAVEIALLNLLDNAVKYSEGAPRVRLAVSRDGGRYVFAVDDQGVGLPKQELKRVFNRFYRVASTGRVRGTGLGLSVSRGLIRGLGGDITAHSDGPGTGSTFTLELPVVKP